MKHERSLFALDQVPLLWYFKQINYCYVLCVVFFSHSNAWYFKVSVISSSLARYTKIITLNITFLMDIQRISSTKSRKINIIENELMMHIELTPSFPEPWKCRLYQIETSRSYTQTRDPRLHSPDLRNKTVPNWLHYLISLSYNNLISLCSW